MLQIDFQDGGHSGHLGFLIGTILAISVLQIAQTKFGVSWPFDIGEKMQYRFLRWWPWQPSWISDQNN